MDDDYVSPGMLAVIEAGKQGHTFAIDDTHALSNVCRWTCTRCGGAVLTRGEIVWGSATEMSCAKVRDDNEWLIRHLAQA